MQKKLILTEKIQVLNLPNLLYPLVIFAPAMPLIHTPRFADIHNKGKVNIRKLQFFPVSFGPLAQCSKFLQAREYVTLDTEE